MDFLYKFAKEIPNTYDADHSSAIATTTGNAIAGGLGFTGNILAAKNLLLDGDIGKHVLYSGDDADVDLTEAKKLRKRMDQLAGAHGFKRSRNQNKWVDATGKGRESIYFNPKNINPLHAGGPHMDPNPKNPKKELKNWRRTIRLGDSPALRRDHILAHELGHAMQSKPLIGAYNLGAQSLKATTALLGISGLLRDGHNDEIHDKIDAGIAGVGTLGGAIMTGVEADASWRGSKGLATAPTRWGRLKQRAQAFRGVPTYAALSVIPGAMYLTGKALRNRVGNKED